jgi:ribonucleoside-diphosphate reductase alpha chain
MGLHEWLLKRGKKYGPDAELEQYLKVYQRSTEIAHQLADAWGISRPVKTRAIAPTGTIGIVAETTTGIEPIFCVSYKRRYLKGQVMHYQYVIDPAAHRLIESVSSPSPSRTRTAWPRTSSAALRSRPGCSSSSTTASRRPSTCLPGVRN